MNSMVPGILAGLEKETNMLKKLSILFSCALIVAACGGGNSGPPGEGSSGSTSGSSTGSNASSTSSSSTSSASNSGSSSSSGSSASSSSNSSTSNSSTSNSGGPLGLDFRPGNSTCLAGDLPANAEADVDTVPAFPELPDLDDPTLLLQLPGDNNRWFVTEQRGRIVSFENASSASSLRTVLDISDRVDRSSGAGESGLLTMAFHPNFAGNGLAGGFGDIYVFYQASRDTTPPIRNDCCLSRLSRFSSNDGGVTFDPNSEFIMIEFPTPFENHFGGHLDFDADGYLYLSIGDGGSGGDPGNRAQDTSNIFGTILRLDVDSGTPYGIPADNPFASEGGLLCNSIDNMETKSSSDGNCAEIYAWGLRNPWRWSFDRETGDLWLGDVGQGEWEEVDIIELGGNYGWNIREGAHCFEDNRCQTEGLIEPVAEVAQPTFRSITGGYIYRGTRVPALFGRYVFGDYATGRLYALEADGNGGWDIVILDSNTGFGIASFAEDQNAELYLLHYGGSIHRITQSGGGPAISPLLSTTGCVDPLAPSQAAPAMIPYDVNAPFWSDGADKQRWFALPDGETIQVTQEQEWAFPVGSVLMKSFSLNSELIETRLLKHHNGGVWAGYSYRWNADGTDAELVAEGGAEAQVHGLTWAYPSAGQCLECHTEVAGRVLGPETAQLNKDAVYPSTGRRANQVASLQAIGVLGGAATTDDILADPYASQADLDDRARAWLHTNCAQCHRPGGPPNLNIDLRYTTGFQDMNVCNIEPQEGDLGIPGAVRLRPGDADSSVLVQRAKRRGDANQMPPISSNLTDDSGIVLITAWVNSLASNICEVSGSTP